MERGAGAGGGTVGRRPAERPRPGIGAGARHVPGAVVFPGGRRVRGGPIRAAAPESRLGAHGRLACRTGTTGRTWSASGRRRPTRSARCGKTWSGDFFGAPGLSIPNTPMTAIHGGGRNAQFVTPGQAQGRPTDAVNGGGIAGVLRVHPGRNPARIWRATWSVLEATYRPREPMRVEDLAPASAWWGSKQRVKTDAEGWVESWTVRHDPVRWAAWWLDRIDRRERIFTRAGEDDPAPDPGPREIAGGQDLRHVAALSRALANVPIWNICQRDRSVHDHSPALECIQCGAFVCPDRGKIGPAGGPGKP